MITLSFLLVIVLFVGVPTLYGIKIDDKKDSFMSLTDSIFLRGFWCIIVVIVHIPLANKNQIQELLWSFAYIGVTFFFMTSAYGLKYNIVHKQGYMEHFWIKRIPVVLIPALIANAFALVMRGFEGGFDKLSPLDFINIDSWVKVLLLYYVIFWIIYHILPKLIGGGYWQDVTMCLLVVGFSFIDYMTDIKITSKWVVEPLGFAYGIIAASFSDKIKNWLKEKWIEKWITLMMVSITLGVTFLVLKPVYFFGDYLLKILLGLAITAFMFETIAKLKVGNRINRLLGGISYEIYLLHHGVFALLTVMDSDINSGIFVITSVAVTVVLAFVLNRICKPMVRLFR